MNRKLLPMPPRRPFHQVIDGVPRCAWAEPDTFRAGLNFRAGRGDMILSTYPKSGTYWTMYIAQLILKGGQPVKTYEEFTSNTHALEYVNHDGWIPELPMRLFFTHIPLRQETMSADAKYVYVARNPWDVCVSFYHMMSNLSPWKFLDGTFDEFLDAFLETDMGYGSYFDHVASGYALKDEPNVLFMTYEDMKRDTRGAILRLARFMDERYSSALEKNEELLQSILEWSSPEYMRDILVMDFKENNDAGWKNMFCRNEASCKKGHRGDNTKFSLVRTAKVGGWKEHFTLDQLVRFERKIQDEGSKASFMDLWKDIREEACAVSKDFPRV